MQLEIGSIVLGICEQLIHYQIIIENFQAAACLRKKIFWEAMQFFNFFNPESPNFSLASTIEDLTWEKAGELLKLLHSL